MALDAGAEQMILQARENATGFYIACHFEWLNGSANSYGVFKVGSGDPNPIIYSHTIYGANGNGNNTYIIIPADQLQTNTAYSFNVFLGYTSDE